MQLDKFFGFNALRLIILNIAVASLLTHPMIPFTQAQDDEDTGINPDAPDGEVIAVEEPASLYNDPFAGVPAAAEEGTPPKVEPTPVAVKSAPVVAPPAVSAPSAPTGAAKAAPKKREEKIFITTLVQANEEETLNIDSVHAILLIFYPKNKPKSIVLTTDGKQRTVKAYFEAIYVNNGQRETLGAYSFNEFKRTLANYYVDYNTTERRLITGLNKEGLAVSWPALGASAVLVGGVHFGLYAASRWGTASKYKAIRAFSFLPDLYHKFRMRIYNAEGGAGTQILKFMWALFEVGGPLVPTYLKFQQLIYNYGFSDDEARVSLVKTLLTCSESLYITRPATDEAETDICANPMFTLSFNDAASQVLDTPLEGNITMGEYLESLEESGATLEGARIPEVDEDAEMPISGTSLTETTTKTDYRLNVDDLGFVRASFKEFFSDEYYQAPIDVDTRRIIENSRWQ